MLLLQSQPVCLVSQSDLNYCVCHWGASRLQLPSILRYLQSDEHRSKWGQCWMHLQSNGFRICCRFNKSTLLSWLCQLPPSATTWQSIMARRANGTILLTHCYLSFVNMSGKTLISKNCNWLTAGISRHTICKVAHIQKSFLFGQCYLWISMYK